MASTRLKTTKSGSSFYEIRCRPSRERPELTTRWYVPDGWSAKAIQKELARQVADFERRIANGEVKSREEAKEENKRAELAAASILTLRQFGERVFMPQKGLTCKETTRSFYQAQLDNHIYPAFGDCKLPDITAAQITALLLSLQADGKSHSTQIAIFTTLDQIFKMAYKQDLLEKNPMYKVDRPRESRENLNTGSPESFTIEEMQRIIAAVEECPLKWRCFIHLLIDSGMRRGEACALQWSDIDWQKSKVTIRGNLCYASDYRGDDKRIIYRCGEKGAVYYTTPKSGKARTIDISEDVMQLLRSLQREQSEKAISSYVFSQEGSPLPMQPQSPTRFFARIAKDCGVDDFHPHKLRHSFASIALTNGADLASISQKLGHANKKITLQMYCHADEESIKKAGDIFRNALQKKQA